MCGYIQRKRRAYNSCLSVNAGGNSVPPPFVIPRKIYSALFNHGEPIGCIGAENASGWVTNVEVLQFTQPAEVRKTIRFSCFLISIFHTSLYELCIIVRIMLLFSCHYHGTRCNHLTDPCTEHLTLLVIRGWSLIKTKYNLPSIVGIALPNAITSGNIQARFNCSGIWPCNRESFSDEEFLPACVTDRPTENQNHCASEFQTSSSSSSGAWSSLNHLVIQFKIQWKRLRNLHHQLILTLVSVNFDRILKQEFERRK